MNNKTKTILSAIFIAAMIIPLTIVDFAEGKHAEDTTKSNIKEMFASVDKDIREYVNTDMNDPVSKKAELLITHSDTLDEIVSILDMNSTLTKDEREILKDLMVRKHIDEMNREREMSEITKDTVTIIIEPNSLSTQGNVMLPPVYADHYIPFPITSWSQVSDDITGGSGVDGNGDAYDVEGDNTFSLLRMDIKTTEVKYTLTFDDEDYPNSSTIDDAYDEYRYGIYERYTDIESFTVDHNGIHFDDIWSDDYKYAYPWSGVHETSLEPFTKGMTIFISNTWNHSMGIENNNSDLEMWEYITDPDNP